MRAVLVCFKAYNFCTSPCRSRRDIFLPQGFVNLESQNPYVSGSNLLTRWKATKDMVVKIWRRNTSTTVCFHCLSQVESILLMSLWMWLLSPSIQFHPIRYSHVASSCYVMQVNVRTLGDRLNKFYGDEWSIKQSIAGLKTIKLETIFLHDASLHVSLDVGDGSASADQSRKWFAPKQLFLPRYLPLISPAQCTNLSQQRSSSMCTFRLNCQLLVIDAAFSERKIILLS